jgi:hypothetical protein
MRVLGEAVDHREDDGLVAHLGQALDKIHRDVRPYLGRNVERLQQPRRLQRLGLVALASGTGPHPVLDQGAIAQNEEVGTEAVQCLLDPFVTYQMG